MIEYKKYKSDLIVYHIGTIHRKFEKKINSKLTVLRTIFEDYKDGEIDECYLNGNKVYIAGLNFYNAGIVIFDTSGKMIGEYNYAWNDIEKFYKKLNSCKVIYRCRNHISGAPAIDIYDLSKLNSNI